ncbi:hypothetical protein BegalDRAFT_1080 [Beggiatoa alba B18LD]|uniref:Uncharacterized protein n=1 Tax=Beggiatoa alba B18LD TaxID=395493 RepID=I3CEE0_9GAMM|nr:hypothetical protein [Beggiatoa alba]EIJ41983.1 hypothetical protein BegalDRAFT_1080 [Beggiatoa alba B18LD]
MDMITSLFCSIDDFSKWFMPLWEQQLSVLGFMVNVIAGLIAYTWKLHKPSLMSRINPKLDDGFNLLNPSQPLFI